MPQYVLSDIHGEADCLHAIVIKMQFSLEDTRHILGKVINRRSGRISLMKEKTEIPKLCS